MTQDVQVIAEPAVVGSATEAEPSTQTATPPVPDFSAQFADLQRRERALQTKANRIKVEAEAEKAKLIDEIKAAPLTKLKEFGLDPTRVVNSYLDQPVVTPEQSTQSKVEALQARLDKQEADAKAAAEEKRVAEFKNGVIASTIESDPVKYELVNNHREGKTLFWNAVIAYYNEFHEVPPYKDLADRVEAHLEEEGKSLLKLNKFKAKKEVTEAAAAIATESKSESDAKSTKGKATTISNSFTANSAPRVTRVGTTSSSSSVSKLDQYIAEKKAQWKVTAARIAAEQLHTK